MIAPQENLHVDVRQFDKICRSCLCEAKSYHLFESNYKESNISEIYQSLCSIQVDCGNGLPNKLCEDCFNSITQFQDFKSRAVASEEALSAALLKNEKDNEIAILEKDVSGPEMYESDTDVKDEFSIDDTERKRDIEKRRNFKLKRLRKKIGKKRVKERSRDTCSFCGKVMLKCKMSEHVRSHTKEKPFSCGICGAKFGQKGNLNRHEKIHLGEKPYACEVCGKAFLRASNLSVHLATAHIEEKKFICSTCGKAFKHKYYLNDHMKTHELNQNSEFGGNFPCEICNKFYRSKATLKVHLLTHKGRSFLCSECGKTFSSHAILIGHRKVHTGQKPYTCTLCNKSFAFPSTLKIHMFVHSGEKPLVCNICNKQFRQHGHLNTHVKSQHSGERPFKCSFCDKSFKQRCNLNVHVRIHTGETPYVCNVCDKGFYDSSSMKKHKRSHDDSVVAKYEHVVT